MSTPNIPKATNRFDNIKVYGPWIIALLILVGYGFFMHNMMGKTNASTENEWVRLTYLFSSIEGIVFTAVGFIFGREVNRTRAVNAEQNEVEAKKETKEIAREVEKLLSTQQLSVSDKSLESMNLDYLKRMTENILMK